MDDYSNFDMSKCDTMLIIGNGFDLDLGFRTSYKDFLNSYQIERLFNNKLVLFLEHQHSLQSWIDIEQELEKYSTEIQNYCENSPQTKKLINNTFKKEYIELRTALKSYLEEISKPEFINPELQKKMYSSAAFHVLQEIFTTCYPYITSFNYTPFIKRLCSEIESIPNSHKVLNIHGSIEKQSDIVFGVEDSSCIPQEHSFLYKSHSLYQKNKEFERVLLMVNNIIFFGYSLGPTDHSYFKQFFVRCNNKKMKFFYHNDDSYDNLISQLQILSGHQLSNFKSRNEIEFINTQDIIKTT